MVISYSGHYIVPTPILYLFCYMVISTLFDIHEIVHEIVHKIVHKIVHEKVHEMWGGK